MIFGWIADHSRSRRTPFLFGLVALAGSTIALSLGENIWILVLGRALQGLSAAIVWTVGLALLVENVGEARTGQAMGWVSLSMTFGVFTGPFIGGIIYEHAGYQAIFISAYILLAFDVLLRLFMSNRQDEKGNERLDTYGTFAEVEGPADPVSSSTYPENETEAAIGSPNISNRSSTKSMLEKARCSTCESVWVNPRMLAALWGCFVANAIICAFESVLPLFVKHTFKWGSTTTALLLLTLTIPSLIGPLVGRINDVYGAKWSTVTGFVIMVPALIALWAVEGNEVGIKALMIILLVVVGIGVSTVTTSVMAEVSYVLHEEGGDELGGRHPYAQAYSVMNVALAMGTFIGPLWAGFITKAASWQAFVVSLGLLSAISVFPVLLLTRGKTRAQGGHLQCQSPIP